MGTLRVMTFNIRGFYHPDDGANEWQHREALNVATIRAAAPHLIGMQEVQTGNLKAYDRLLDEYHWTAWPEYGNRPPFEWPAIYWDPRALIPIDSGGFWLSETPERFSASWDTDCVRSAAWIKFRDTATGATIVHLNTHLDHISEQARAEGTRLILWRLQELQADGGIAIVTADFNARPRSPTHRHFTDAGFTDTYLAAGHADDPERSFTYHGWRGREFRRDGTDPVRIDWILVRDGARWRARVTSCEIIRDAAPPVYPGDHYPVLAELLIEPSDERLLRRAEHREVGAQALSNLPGAEGYHVNVPRQSRRITRGGSYVSTARATASDPAPQEQRCAHR